ncbi:MAG: S16 family serine protease [Acidimicrobiales bacterium]|nr:S16 family serine protease [Acidimicrobiales bacterium]
MLPPPDAPDARADRRRPRWLTRSGTAVLVLVCLVALSFVVPAQWLGRVVPGHAMIDDPTVAQKPGSARATNARVEISAADVDDPDGAILFTTVALDSTITVFDWLRSEFDDDIVLRPRVEVLGTRSIEENRERNLEMMRVSKDGAVVTALEYLGFDVIDETGVAFESVIDDGPAHEILEPGDVIVAIDGDPVTSVTSLLDILATKVPGDVGVITVDNIDTGEIRDAELTWGENPEREGAFIGIANVVPRQEELPLPFDVSIDSGNIGGPSAGLAFTLTIIDLLTEGDLTGGQNVAVTGTIEPGGNVGNVGGVGQKAAAAHEAGAVAFVVPVESVEIAEEHARDMPIIGVETLEEALDALASLGGDTTDLTLVSG